MTNYKIFENFWNDPEVKEAVDRWATCRVHGFPADKCAESLIDRLEYLLFLAGSPRRRDEDDLEQSG